MGTMLKYGSEGAKQFYEMYVLDPDHAKAHIEGDIHIHDLDFLTLTTTCCQIDIIKLFKGGFSTGHGFLREPKDIQSYSALACIAIQSNQNDQHGGQSIPNFEYGMAPGVTLTYAKLYRKNLEKALDMMCGDADSERDASEILAEVRGEDRQGAGSRGGHYFLALCRGHHSEKVRRGDRKARGRRRPPLYRQGDRARDLSGDGSADTQPQHDALPRRRADTIQLA